MKSGIWNSFEKILRLILVRFLHLSFLEERWDSLMQFVKFALVGFSNTLISYLVYLIGIRAGLNYLAAYSLGFLLSVVNAFYWNNRYVFSAEAGEERSLWKSFCKTFLSYAGTGLVLNNVLLFLQIDMLCWNETLAPLLNLIITIPLNFLLNKLWAFRGKRKGDVQG